MATTKAVVTQQHLTDIADAIRTKGGADAPLLPSQMAAAIEAIPTGGGGLSYPQPWEIDGGTYVWYRFEKDDYKAVCIVASYIAPNGFTIDWGDGQVDTIAASVSLTSRNTYHEYSNEGDYKVKISGYESCVFGSSSFGIRSINSSDYASASAMFVRQFQMGVGATGVGIEFYSLGNVIAISAKIESASTNGLLGNGSIKYFRFHEGSVVPRAFFRSVTGIEEIDLNGVTSIGVEAFVACGCKRIINAVDVNSVGSSSFNSTFNLESIDFSSNLQDIPHRAFANFYGGKSSDKLTTLGDMSNVVSIAEYGFRNCKSLKEFISKKLENIGHYAFIGCIKIKFITCGLVTTSNVVYAFPSSLTYEPDAQGNTLVVYVKNTTSDMIQRFPLSGYAGAPLTVMVACSDGKIRFPEREYGRPVADPWSSVADLPMKGFDWYQYTIGDKTYQWNDVTESYEEVV